MQHGGAAQHAHQGLNVHRHLGNAEGEHTEVAPGHGLEGQASAHVERGEGHGVAGFQQGVRWFRSSVPLQTKGRPSADGDGPLPQAVNT